MLTVNIMELLGHSSGLQPFLMVIIVWEGSEELENSIPLLSLVSKVSFHVTCIYATMSTM